MNIVDESQQEEYDEDKNLLSNDQETKIGKKCCATNLVQKWIFGLQVKFQDEEFDHLDLTYITKQIIVMSYPGQGFETIWRNSVSETKRFFDQQHPGHYKIYNFCSEQKYDKSQFDGNVVEFPFADHGVPSMNQIFQFCLDLDEWLAKDPQNVVGLHCQAGRGRSGLMVCCYLIWAKKLKTVEDSLQYFGRQRFKNGKGVNIPSQVRYVHHFQTALKNGWKLNHFNQKQYTLKLIKFRNIPNVSIGGGCRPWFKITNKFLKNGVHDSRAIEHFFCLNRDLITFQTESLTTKIGSFDFNVQVTVLGDVKIEFFNSTILGSKRMFSVWFNPSLIENNKIIKLNQQFLDKAWNSKSYQENFAIEIYGTD